MSTTHEAEMKIQGEKNERHDDTRSVVNGWRDKIKFGSR
jgi:hypothetical protein